MTHPMPASGRRTATALAVILAAGLAGPVGAQETDGRLAVRDVPETSEQEAVQADLRDRLDAEAARMRRTAEAIRAGVRDLDRCTARATTDTPQDRDAVPTLMDCFVDQAMVNQQALTEWAVALKDVEIVFTDGVRKYRGLAEAKTAEIDALYAEIDIVDTERAELRRRLDRVQAFLQANGTRLEGAARHEAIRLRMEWDQINHRMAHTTSQTGRMASAQEAFEQAAEKLAATARTADLQALDFTYRAEREGFYIAEVSEAMATEVALEQVAGMTSGMRRVSESMDAARVALDAASEQRPAPVITPLSESQSPVLGETAAAEGLEDWILGLDTEAGR